MAEEMRKNIPADDLCSDRAADHGRISENSASDGLPLLVFDHDGTLHDSMRIFEPAMRDGMRYAEEEFGYPVRYVSSEEISSFLGLNGPDTWKLIASEIPLDVEGEVMAFVGRRLKELAPVSGRWFPGIGEALDELKADGYHMVILSNCETALGKIYWEAYGIGRWFDHYYDCETYHFAPKEEIMRLIKEEYGRDVIMIGDRNTDKACADAAGAKFIACRYGYGNEQELQGADAYADSPAGLPACVRSLTKCGHTAPEQV